MITQSTKLEPALVPRSRGYELDTDPSTFGYLNEFDLDPITNAAEAREAYDRDGYLFVKGFWRNGEVKACRRALTDKLAELGLLHPDRPAYEGIPHPETLEGISTHGKGSATVDGVARNMKEVTDLLYRGRLIEFYERFLGHDVVHFDEVWLRAMAPGFGTVPHCDRVFMGRGTDHLFTCWVPYRDIDPRIGGLILLDNSREVEEETRAYWERDVDEYCEDALPDHVDLEATRDNKVWNGAMSDNPVRVQRDFGGRWLTARCFEMGDFLTFSLKTVHGSLDNQSDCIRLSTDTRYQRADEPADERWVGPGPRGHVGYHKRSRVC